MRTLTRELPIQATCQHHRGPDRPSRAELGRAGPRGCPPRRRAAQHAGSASHGRSCLPKEPDCDFSNPKRVRGVASCRVQARSSQLRTWSGRPPETGPRSGAKNRVMRLRGNRSPAAGTRTRSRRRAGVAKRSAARPAEPPLCAGALPDSQRRSRVGAPPAQAPGSPAAAPRPLAATGSRSDSIMLSRWARLG